MKIIDANTVSVSGQYTEPVVDANGQPLTDLAFTTLYYEVQGTTNVVKVQQVPATSPNGGGVIPVTVVVPLASGQTADFVFWVTATSIGGLEGPQTPFTMHLTRAVAPGAPTGFTLA